MALERSIWEYRTLIQCILLGPMAGLFQAWVYVSNYVISYIHHDNPHIGYTSAQNTLNFFAVGNFLGGIGFYPVVQLLGYRNGLVFNIGINTLSFWLIQYANYHILVLCVVMLIWGFVLENVCCIAAYLCCLRYPELGAIGPGTAISGLVFGAYLWVVLSKHFINPDNIDPVKGEIDANGFSYAYYSTDITDNIPKLYNFFIGYGICMMVLVKLFVQEPEGMTSNIGALVSSIISGADMSEFIKVSKKNSERMDESAMGFMNAFGDFTGASLTNQGNKSDYHEMGKEDIEDSEKVLKCLELEDDSTPTGGKKKNQEMGTFQPEIELEDTPDKKKPIFSNWDGTDDKEEIQNNYKKKFIANESLQLQNLNHTTDVVVYDSPELKHKYMANESINFQKYQHKTSSPLQADRKASTPDNVKVEEHYKKLQDDDFYAIIKTTRFTYIYVFFIVGFGLGNWFNINMKSIGLNYYSEEFIVSTVVYAPFFAGFCRIFGGLLINQFGFRTTQTIVVVTYISFIVIWTAFIDNPIVFVLGFYINNGQNGILQTCGVIVCLHLYGADIAVKVQSWFATAQCFAMIFTVFMNSIVFKYWGFGATSGQFVEILILLSLKLSYFDH